MYLYILHSYKIINYHFFCSIYLKNLVSKRIHILKSKLNLFKKIYEPNKNKFILSKNKALSFLVLLNEKRYVF